MAAAVSSGCPTMVFGITGGDRSKSGIARGEVARLSVTVVPGKTLRPGGGDIEATQPMFMFVSG